MELPENYFFLSEHACFSVEVSTCLDKGSRPREVASISFLRAASAKRVGRSRFQWRMKPGGGEILKDNALPWNYCLRLWLGWFVWPFFSYYLPTKTRAKCLPPLPKYSSSDVKSLPTLSNSFIFNFVMYLFQRAHKWTNNWGTTRIDGNLTR